MTALAPNTPDPPPAVAIPACSGQVGDHAGYTVVAKYVAAVADGAGAAPFVLPPLGAWYGAQDGGWRGLAARLDGVLLTGSPTNIAVERYGGTEPAEGMARDPARDATNLALIEACLAEGVPILAICRGFQELNVACGGSLHPRLDRVPGRQVHHEDPNDPLAVQYGPAHRIHLAADGELARLAGTREVQVNSVHSQGIAELAPALVCEASAPDGTVEAARLPGAAAFTLGVQWHPEWRFAESAVSRALFAAFGRACRARAAGRARAAPTALQEP